MVEFIIFVLIIYITGFIIKKYNDNKTTTSPTIQENKKTNYNLYYKPKRYIISLTELKFYKELLEIAKRSNLILLTQVSLYNIIETKQTTYKQTAFNKIRSKSIDFVLADIETCRARVCIELDDYTHKNLDRIDRDNFLNNLFSDLGIKLMRIPVSKQYDIEKIETEIKNTILECKY